MTVCSRFLRLSLLTLAAAMASCDSEPEGLLQQRIAELESQSEAHRRRADELQIKLDAAAQAQATSAASATKAADTEATSKAERRAALAAAVAMLGESLSREAKPGIVSVYAEMEWVGVKVDRGGEARGVAVPFFRDSQGQWTSGWSPAQILGGIASPPPTTASATPAPSPEAPPREAAPKVAEAPPAPAPEAPGVTPPPAAPPTTPPGRKPPEPGKKSYWVDPQTGKMYRVNPDGSRQAVPELR